MNFHVRALAVHSVFGWHVEMKLYQIIRDPIEPDSRRRIRKRGLQGAPLPRQNSAHIVQSSIGIFQPHSPDSIVEVDLERIWTRDRVGTGNVDWALFGRGDGDSLGQGRKGQQ